MNMNNSLKHGFSLFEAFVVMLIVSIFVALMANTVAHRPKAKVTSEAHGRFECYYDADNGKLYQQIYTEGKSPERVVAKEHDLKFLEDDGHGGTVDKIYKRTACEFTPPSYAKYLVIDAVGGGAGGSFTGGASEGQFVSTFYSTIERKYYVIPGKGGKKQQSSSAAENGTETLVYSVDKDGYASVIVVADGGKAAVSLENTTVNDVIACAITDWPKQDQYNCHITPSCEVVEGKVQVSFCRSKGSYITVPLTYKANKKNSNEVEMRNPRYIVNNVYTEKKDDKTWLYHDISQWSDYNDKDLDPTKKYRESREAGWKPTVNDEWVPSMYTMELIMDNNVGEDGWSESNLHNIVNSMQYETKMLDAHVGRGAKKNQNGGSGGTLFLW